MVPLYSVVSFFYFMWCYLSVLGSASWMITVLFFSPTVFGISGLYLWPSILHHLTYYSKFGSFHDVPHFLYVPLVFSKRISNLLLILSLIVYLLLDSFYLKDLLFSFLLGLLGLSSLSPLQLESTFACLFFYWVSFSNPGVSSSFPQTYCFLGYHSRIFIFKFYLILLTWYSVSSLNSLIVWWNI